MNKIGAIPRGVFFICTVLLACNNEKIQDTVKTDLAQDAGSLMYDSVKAAEYGADEYGMKKYVMAFLKRGPNRDLDSADAVKLQMAHMDNIGRMAEAGKLVLAGPFFGAGEIRGIYIFNVRSLKEAEDLTNTDPAIQAGSLVMELKEWYGSAGIMAVTDIHKTWPGEKLWKIWEFMIDHPSGLATKVFTCQ